MALAIQRAYPGTGAVTNSHGAPAMRPTDRPTDRRNGKQPHWLPSNRGPVCSLPPSLPPSGSSPSMVPTPSQQPTQQHTHKQPRPESAPTYLPTAVCTDCGAPYEQEQEGARCEDCQPAESRAYERHGRRRGKTAARGYGSRWQRLSSRARALQPFCSDCGSPYELTADHSIEAWRRAERGQSIRLQDIDVVCLRCNSERGAARGERASDQWRERAGELDELAARFTDDTGPDPWGGWPPDHPA